MSDTDTISLTNQGKVAYFYEKMTGRLPTIEEAVDRLDEEIDEFEEVLGEWLNSPVLGGDIAPHLIKEMTDCLYTLYGLAIANGWDLDGAFDATHRSNLTKEFTAMGKVQKGENYRDPRMEAYLGLA